MKLSDLVLNKWLKHFCQSYCFILFAFLPLHTPAATEFKVFDLQHRFAEDILPIIQPLVGDDGTATGMQNHLIIRASPERMIEIEQTISSLDIARENLKITIRQQSNIQTHNSRIAANGRKRIGNVSIGTSHYPINSPDGVQLDIENNQSTMTGNSQQLINVMDGSAAYIKVGQSIPYTEEWVTFTHRYVSVQKTTQFAEITTGFSVRPRSIGSQIELEIRPRIAELNQNQYIDFQELGTVIRVNRGEWVDLGGVMQANDEVSRAILSKAHNEKNQNNALSIKVD